MSLDPYASLPTVRAIRVTSDSFNDGDTLPVGQVSAMTGTGRDASPQLTWSGAPEETRSYAVTCFDPDAPTASGFWHLAAYNLPASLTSLEEGVLTLDRRGELPSEAQVLRNDGGVVGYVGATPPPGHGLHRYMFVVHALDTKLDLDELASPAFLGFQMFGHTLARGRITGIFSQ